MARRQVGLKRQAEIIDLFEKVENKFARQEHSHEGLTESFIEERFGEGLLSRPDFDKMTSKQATEYISNAKDYLSRKGNISTLSNEGYAWSTDVRKLKQNIKKGNIGEVVDEALSKRSVTEISIRNGKIVKETVDKSAHYGEDPGIVPTTFEIGDEIYGYKGREEKAYSVIDSQEKVIKSIGKLKQKRKLFSAKKIVNAKENYLKTLASSLGLDYKGDYDELRSSSNYMRVYNKLANMSPSQFYYMYKTSEIFNYNFWYSQQELEDWISNFESEVDVYNQEFGEDDENSPYAYYKQVLNREGIE